MTFENLNLNIPVLEGSKKIWEVLASLNFLKGQVKIQYKDKTVIDWWLLHQCWFDAVL